jgi:putative tryptophan/tyrosine transport system substrate-binding protein
MLRCGEPPDLILGNPLSCLIGEGQQMPFDRLKRREFITLLGGATAWPLATRAQQPAMPVIGFLGSASPDLWADRLRAFHQGLNEVGYVEGRNVKIEYRWAADQNARFASLATDLVSHGVEVIAGCSLAAAFAAKAATTTIPIVFAFAADPVEVGLVASLRRPSGNITGATNLNQEVLPKRLELLHEAIPSATTVALLIKPTVERQAQLQLRDLQIAARALGMQQLHIVHASTEGDLKAVFASLESSQVGGLVVGTDPFFTSRREQLGALTVRHKVPAIYQYREFAATGGLMSYGGSLTEVYRINGLYTGRILKGEKAADLPVQQVTKVELVINLITARALGLTFPLTLLGRADEIIE